MGKEITTFELAEIAIDEINKVFGKQTARINEIMIQPNGIYIDADICKMYGKLESLGYELSISEDRYEKEIMEDVFVEIIPMVCGCANSGCCNCR